MPETITLRWSGPPDATASSTYKVEASLDGTTWTVLAAAQAATSPYASPASTLAAAANYGDASLTLVNAAAFPASGYGWLDNEALVSWTGKTSNTLTGVTWYSGLGSYTAGSPVVHAHENLTHEATPTNAAVLYRITHQAGGRSSAPTYAMYYAPGPPASADHCAVIVSLASDLGIQRHGEARVTAYLVNQQQVALRLGEHLRRLPADGNMQLTNALGIAVFHCWRSSRRQALGASADGGYIFVIEQAGAPTTTFVAPTIPDRDWVLLSWIASPA